MVFNFFTDFKYLLDIMLRCLVFLSPNTPGFYSDRKSVV